MQAHSDERGVPDERGRRSQAPRQGSLRAATGCRDRHHGRKPGNWSPCSGYNGHPSLGRRGISSAKVLVADVGCPVGSLVSSPRGPGMPLPMRWLKEEVGPIGPTIFWPSRRKRFGVPFGRESLAGRGTFGLIVVPTTLLEQRNPPRVRRNAAPRFAPPPAAQGEPAKPP